MTTGALIFAFNNEQTDYVAMAVWSAANIRRHLGIPTAVITDVPDDPRLRQVDAVIPAKRAAGGTRYFEDYDSTVTWYNAGRVDAYSLTPWDQTLLLDADFVVASSDLTQVLAMSQDVVCHDIAYDLARAQQLSGLNVFGRYNIPMSWATVMMFRKSAMAAYVFDCMHMIRENWQHYRDLYGINNRTYRNDYALSIALGIVNGHQPRTDFVPWALATVMPQDALTMVDQDVFDVAYTDTRGKTFYHRFGNQDFHAMGKSHLEKLIADA